MDTAETEADRAKEKMWKERAGHLRRRVDGLERHVMDRLVLQRTLPVRTRTLPARSSAPEARERERRFRLASESYARAVEDTESFGDHTRVTTLDGLTWWVPLTAPDDQASVERYLGQQDFPYRTMTLTREVAIGGTMIDLGANTGRMSIPRVILGDVGIVYCAEPDPLNYACLVRNVRDNNMTGLVMPDRLAIGASSGTVRFERAKSPGGHKVIGAEAQSRREVVEVRALTLDAWVERIGIDLDQVCFVKVDVQGSEIDVLEGAPRVLMCRHIAWQIEVDLLLLAERGFTPEDLYTRLRAHFTHFIDLSRRATGARVRPIAELGDALVYVSGGTEGRTDVLVFTLEDTVEE